jgi:hypothetical protein
MYHASGGSAGSSWGGELKALKQNLRFPAAGKGERFDSPADRNRTRLFTVRDNFESLRTKTGTSEGK